MSADRRDARGLALERTEVSDVPLVPEIRLRLASEAFKGLETTERELAAGGIAVPFWAFAWPGGVALSRYVLDHPAAVRGRRVLDLGSGSGLVAMAAALAGAASVTANDVDPLALAAVELNAELNGLQVATSGADLTVADQRELLQDVQVVLAGDLAYDAAMSEGAFRLLRSQARRGAEVLVGDPGRTYLPRDLEELASYDVPVDPTIEAAEVKVARVYRLGGSPGTG